MKTLYFISGTMGVGKTTACEALNRKLDKSVFLDGDWCWMANPFQVTEETKKMVVENIVFLLNQFLASSAYENVVFCWVMNAEAICESILSKLRLEKVNVKRISLICSENALRERLMKDVKAGKRSADVIERSVQRLSHYEKMNTVKLDVSGISAEEAADRMIAM